MFVGTSEAVGPSSGSVVSPAAATAPQAVVSPATTQPTGFAHDEMHGFAAFDQEHNFGTHSDPTQQYQQQFVSSWGVSVPSHQTQHQQQQQQQHHTGEEGNGYKSRTEGGPEVGAATDFDTWMPRLDSRPSLDFPGLSLGQQPSTPLQLAGGTKVGRRPSDEELSQFIYDWMDEFMPVSSA